ncbi:MAG: hypothetical protein QOK47_297 [Actinomycetota bacterium]|nr:hypothetical protein [Actinomycetota bacterium]
MIQSVVSTEEGEVVAIVNRRGEVTEVPVEDIVAGKFFPA